MNKFTPPSVDRRHFLRRSSLFAGGLLTAGSAKTFAADEPTGSPFKISLAQWSHHRALQAGELDNLDWPAYVAKHFDIKALEWVNQFFYEKPADAAYLAEMKKRTGDLGVENVLIMCDRIGDLGDSDDAKRSAAVEGHYVWLDAAKTLGCHSIRVNARSDDKLSYDEQKKLCVDGLHRLSEHAAPMGLGVIVENHGGLSSNGAWLAEVMKGVGLDNCGTLPDFGNFYVAKKRPDTKPDAWKAMQEKWAGDPYQEDETGIYYDRYQGIEDLMPFAKGVSAKSHDFDEKGNETHTNFTNAMRIVKQAGYTGYVGIEYEGSVLSEDDGIKATKALLEKTFAKLEQPPKEKKPKAAGAVEAKLE